MASLKEHARRLKKQRPRDLDPEDEAVLERDDSSGDDEILPSFDGREHYEAVSKSKLRRAEQPQLGEKYQGVAVSRTDMQTNSDDDPFAPVDEDDEDDPFGSRKDKDESSDSARYNEDDAVMSEEEKSQLDEDEQVDSDSVSESDSDIEMKEQETDASDGTSVSSQTSSHRESGHGADRKALLDLMKKDTARVAATLSSGEDVKQGHAVRLQKTSSDRLLDARMKFQKGLTTSNTVSAEFITDGEAKDAVEKAEAAAVALWSTLDSIRCTFLSSSSDSNDSRREKRQRPTPLKAGQSTLSSTIWKHSKSLEANSLPHRRETLNQWSLRTRPITASHPSRSNNPHTAPKDPNLTDILDEYLSRDSAKLITSSPSNPKADSSGNTYFSDDEFYQSLLRDLIASRTDIPISSTNTPSQSKPSPLNNQRNRRNVDTKASKGRKIRYTVHEKLISFMAPEDRSTWSKSARQEFFGSLFGGKITSGNNADDGNGAMDDYYDKLDGGEASLRLFQT